MRIKDLWEYCPLPAKLKLVYNRLTLSRVITAYFILSLLHCGVQVALQINAFTLEHAPGQLVRGIINAGNVSEKFAMLDTDDNLELCTAIPGTVGNSPPCIAYTGRDSALNHSSVNSGPGHQPMNGKDDENDKNDGNDGGKNKTESHAGKNIILPNGMNMTIINGTTVSVNNVTMDLSIPTKAVISFIHDVAPVHRTPTGNSSNATIASDSASQTTGSDLKNTVTGSAALKKPTKSQSFNVPLLSEILGKLRQSGSEGFRNSPVNHPTTSDKFGLTQVKDTVSKLLQHFKRDDVLGGVTITSMAGPNGLTFVNASGLPGQNNVITLGPMCTSVLAWPDQFITEAKREAITMIVFQAWLFGISIVAILTESIPHVLAALVTHLLSTGWAIFQITRTIHFRNRFTSIVTNNVCHGVEFLPTYWGAKFANQVPILVLNCVSLIASAYLSWKISKHYGLHTFNRVGGSDKLHHIYLLVLVLSASIQLTTFFLAASIILWNIQLFKGPISLLSSHRAVYLVTFVITAALILPWFYMGWTSVRRERRRLMIAFLVTSVLLIASQTGMFISPIYRLTFNTWSFFATLTIAAYVMLVVTFFMAISCRYFFGRGLAHFLQVQEALEQCDFTPVYFDRGSVISTIHDREHKEKNQAPWDPEADAEVVVKRVSLKLMSEDPTTQDLVQVPLTPNNLPFRAQKDFIARTRPEDKTIPQVINLSQILIQQSPLDNPALLVNGRRHRRADSSASWYRSERGRDFIARSSTPDITQEQPTLTRSNSTPATRVRFALAEPGTPPYESRHWHASRPPPPDFNPRNEENNARESIIWTESSTGKRYSLTVKPGPKRPPRLVIDIPPVSPGLSLLEQGSMGSTLSRSESM